MHRSPASFAKAAAAAIAAAIAAFALAGCITIQLPASNSDSSASADSSSASSETASSSSVEASSAASSSSSSASPSSDSPIITPSGVDSDVKNDNPGYSFKADKAFQVKIDNSFTYVYTGKDGISPYFNVSAMKNSSGQSVEELLSGTGNMAANRLGNRLVKGPITNTVRLSNREMKGIEFTFMNEAGTQEYVTLNYAEDVNGLFFTWAATYPVDDSVTPEAMQHAMDTFHMLAS